MPDLLPPLVPPGCDLRDFRWMPVDIARLFGSEFHALSDDTTWRAGVTLWLKSYHQVPASSLPDDDVALARLAEFGRDIKAWRKVKAGALRGWSVHSDGRLYHRVVSEKALEAWIDRLLQRKASQAGNAKRYGHAFDAAEVDAQVSDSMARLTALNPNSRTFAKRIPRGTAKPDAVTPDELPSGDDGASTGSMKPSHRELDGSPVGTPNALPEHSQGTGTEQNGTDPPTVPLTGDSSPGPRSGRAKPAGTPLPEDWKPKPAHYGAAAMLGRDPSWVDDEAEGMRAWAQAEAHRSITRKANWDQAFHNRLRENAKGGRSMRGPAGPRLVHGLANDSGVNRSTSGPSSARAGIAAALTLHRGDPL